MFNKGSKDWSRGEAEKWIRSHDKDTKKSVSDWMRDNGGEEMEPLIKYDNNPTPLAIFAPIVKVDKEKRMVWGYATTERLDKQNEIVDYDGSKEAFKDWPGNIREMHQPKAVGKAIEIVPDDEKRGFYVGAYVSKGAEDTWQKVLEGVLTGYSIGGQATEKVVEQQRDVEKGSVTTVTRVKKYKMSELSLVDNPANPDGVFTLVKADGTFTDLVGTEESIVIAKNFMQEYGKITVKHDLDAVEKVFKEVVASILASSAESKNDLIQQSINDYRKCFVGPNSSVCGQSVSKVLTELLSDYQTMGKNLRMPERVFSEGYDSSVWKDAVSTSIAKGEAEMGEVFLLNKEMENPDLRDNLPDSDFGLIQRFDGVDQPRKVRKYLLKSKVHARAAYLTLRKEGLKDGLTHLERYELLKRIQRMGIEADESVLKQRGEKDLPERAIETWDEWAGSFTECVNQLIGKEGIGDPEALCAWLECQVADRWPAEDKKKFVEGSPMRLTVAMMKEVCPSCAEKMVQKGISAYKISREDIQKLAPIVSELILKNTKGGKSRMEIEKQLDLSALAGKTISLTADMLMKDENGKVVLTDAAVEALSKQYGKKKDMPTEDDAEKTAEATETEEEKAAKALDLKKAGGKHSPENPDSKGAGAKGEVSGAHSANATQSAGTPATGKADPKKKGPGDPEATYKMVCPKCEHNWLVKYKTAGDVEKKGSLTDDSESVTYSRDGDISDVTDKTVVATDMAKLADMPVIKELSDNLAKALQKIEASEKKNEELQKVVEEYMGNTPAPRKGTELKKVERTFATSMPEDNADAPDAEMAKFDLEKKDVIEKISLLRTKGQPIPAELQQQAEKLVSKSFELKFSK